MNGASLKPLYTWRSAVAFTHGPKSPTTRHVLLMLGLHMNERSKSCFPSVDSLVQELGLTKRSLCAHLEITEREVLRRGHGFKDRGLKGRHFGSQFAPLRAVLRPNRRSFRRLVTQSVAQSSVPRSTPLATPDRSLRRWSCL
jgi:hypothetical protein